MYERRHRSPSDPAPTCEHIKVIGQVFNPAYFPPELRKFSREALNSENGLGTNGCKLIPFVSSKESNLLTHSLGTSGQLLPP